MENASARYSYNSIFPSRLRELMDQTHTTQEKLSQICDVTRQAISQWRNGITRPDILYLTKIAKYFSVSTDYLLGLTDVKTTDTATKELCSTLGLSEEAIKILCGDKTSDIAKSFRDVIYNDLAEECQTETERKDLTDGELLAFGELFSQMTSTVFNALIDDLTKTTLSAIKDQENSVESLPKLLYDFYRTLKADTICMHTKQGSLQLHERAFFTAEQAVKKRSYAYYHNVKDLLLNSYITDITARLSDIKSNYYGGEKHNEEKC